MTPCQWKWRQGDLMMKKLNGTIVSGITSMTANGIRLNDVAA